MRSSNPVLSRADAFNGQAGVQPQQAQYAPGQPYPGQPYPGQPYPGQPYPAPGQEYGYPPAPAQPVMTIDDVITKSAITIGVLMVVAAITFMVVPPELLSMTAIVSGLVAFGTVMLVAFRRSISPGMVLVYSVIEGVFIGAFSSMFEYLYPGIVLPAVLGTFVAAGVTLAAYKYFRIRVTSQFRKMVTIGTIAFAGVMLLNLVLSLFGINTGIISVTGSVSLLAIAASALGVGLAVLNLILDFDYVERGIAVRAPASESWRAAFGLTVTMVWLYTELLRILSYFQRS